MLRMSFFDLENLQKIICFFKPTISNKKVKLNIFAKSLKFLKCCRNSQ